MLYGDAGSDRLFGGEGSDYLADDQGVNRLEGGEGNDTYVANNPDGYSELLDSAESDDTYRVAGDARVTDDGGSDLYNITHQGDVVIVDADGTDNYILSSNGSVRVVDRKGRDSYTISDSTGVYRIADADAAHDSIQLDGFSLSTAFFSVDGSTTEWQNLSNTLRLHIGSEAIVTSSQGSSVSLEGFNEGDFGIKLFNPQRDTSLSTVTNDLLNPDASSNTKTGTDGADTLYGSSTRNLLVGFAGNDQLYGNTLADTLDGGSGDDRLSGGDGNDRVFGGEGSDRIKGGTVGMTFSMPTAIEIR